VADPEIVLPDVIRDLKNQNPDLLVLLSHAGVAESKRLAGQFPEFHLIVSATSVEDPLYDNPVNVGETLIVSVGHKGKHVGVVGYFPDEKQHRLRFELLQLDKQRFRESPEMIEHLRVYQDELRDLELAVEESQNLAIAHPSGAVFVGADKCGECHTKAYAHWKTTPHAHAAESLDPAHQRRGHERLHGIVRLYDPECICCHVVGWNPQDVVPYKSGYVSHEQTPHLLGSQCENCHGPGSRHVELAEADDADAAKSDVRVTLAQAKESLCTRCHDLDNSPKFKFDEYWEKVAHPWRD
jgi:hypothetical protein